MEVDFLLLADGAQVAGDKLYVLGGGWTVLWGRSFPINHTIAVAVGIMVPWEETNQAHSVEILILSEDGNQIGQPLVSGQLEVGRPPGIPPGTAQRAMMAVSGPVSIESPGRYEVVVRVNGENMKHTAFTAVRRNS